MVFGDLINRQKSQIGKHHECPNYIDEYRFTCQLQNA